MDIVVVIAVIIALAYMQISVWTKSNIETKAGFYWSMFAMHYVITLVYMLYAFATRSDSFEYYDRSAEETDWFVFWESGTLFVRFLTWPFSHAMGASFISTMLIFSYFGFMACGYWYLAIKENIRYLPTVWSGMTWAEIVMLLPNIHFWSASIGKGAIMFFGIAIYAYGLSRFNKRIVYMVVGMFLTYMIRPHLTLVMAMGTGLGIMMAGKSLPWYLRLLLTLVAAGFAAYFFQGTIEFTGLEQNQLDRFLEHRTQELGKADSGVDISNYSLPMKLFTFWFRPLFVDAPGAFGYIVSFENLLYIYMLFIIVGKGFRSFAGWNGWYKSCLFIFILASIILAQVSGNLGIAMRQKAQLMPLFFIAFLKAQEYLYEREAVTPQQLEYA